MNFPTRDYKSMVAFYGPVGQNQTKLILPYPMRLAWDKKKIVTKITCHEKVHDSLERILKGILSYYGSVEEVQRLNLDLFGGCLNVRKVRHGYSWSIHSWGAAIDLDPEHNSYGSGRDKAAMPQAVIDIFRSEDWVSLGQERNYDFMHFQAARL